MVIIVVMINIICLWIIVFIFVMMIIKWFDYIYG